MTRPGHLWTDQEMLRALHLIDVEGLSRSEAAKRFGLSKNTVHALHRRCWADSMKHFPDTSDDGSLPPMWWQR